MPQRWFSTRIAPSWKRPLPSRVGRHARFQGRPSRVALFVSGLTISFRPSIPTLMSRLRMTPNRGWEKLCCLAVAMVCSAGSASAQVSDRLEIYGYFDVETESKRSGDQRNWHFDQHHFNVITVYRPQDRWRVFAEVEWEHGAFQSRSGGAGLIELERAWVEYSHSPALQVRLGKFLAPFGIYNLRHDATPTYLMSFLPASVYGKHSNPLGESQRLYAKFGTGVQLLGRVPAGAWSADYAVYLTNSRGLDAAELDGNMNKGVGGRLLLHSPNDSVRVGISLYSDRNGLAADTRQYAIGVDFAFEKDALLVEVEGLVPRLEGVNEARAPDGLLRTGRSGYVQGSYRLTDRLTPFGRFEYYDADRQRASDVETTVVGGLNVMVNPSVYLKSEVQTRQFRGTQRPDDTLFVSSISVAF